MKTIQDQVEELERSRAKKKGIFNTIDNGEEYGRPSMHKIGEVNYDKEMHIINESNVSYMGT